MEGTVKPSGTALEISAVKRSLFKGAFKTMIKLRLGRKLVSGLLAPEADETAEDAKDFHTGSKSLDKQVKEIAEALVKLRDAIGAQKNGVPALQRIATEKKRRHGELVAAARRSAPADSRRAWEAAGAAEVAADAAQFAAKDGDKAAGRAEASLREMTERLHRINGSGDSTSTKEAQLKKLKSDIAAKQLDTSIANLDPADPKAGKLIADQIEKRFGVKFKLNETNVTVDSSGKQVFADNARTVDPKKEAETLKELYLTLAKTPVFPASKLKKLTVSLRPSNATSEGGVYYEGNKLAEITCKRPQESFDYSRQLARADFFPGGVEPDCQPANTDPVNYFNWATLHEVAHAVDAKHKFMGSRMKGAKYGGWTDHGKDVGAIATAVAEHFGKTLGTGDRLKLRDYAVQRLQSNPASGAPDRTPEETAVKGWVDAVRVTKGLWWDGAQSEARKLGSRVYHESYEGGWWVSYDAGARRQGIHGYQFRAPGEWFAELYAAYYSDKLKPSHPIVADLTGLEAPR
jgi:hypothetical protein